METNQSLIELAILFKDKKWFCDIELDDYNRYIIYNNYMNSEVLTSVPDKLNGKQVLLHFFSSKVAKRENFINNASHIPFKKIETNSKLEIIDDEIEELSSDHLENDLDDLLMELDRLHAICDNNTIQNIFFELHDGKNAITNLSVKYPKVRDSLKLLYEEYGFDIIHDEIVL